LTKEDAFNLEKETKIINPHRMELSTTNGVNFKNFKVAPKTKTTKQAEDKDAPLVGITSN
jgi:hypothetical protein